MNTEFLQSLLTGPRHFTITNDETKETHEVIANTYDDAIHMLGWPRLDCRCIEAVVTKDQNIRVLAPHEVKRA